MASVASAEAALAEAELVEAGKVDSFQQKTFSMKNIYPFLVVISFGLLFGVPSALAQSKPSIPDNFCITQQEYQLYSLINSYRIRLALDPIPLSKSLCYVAKTHAFDLANYDNPNDKCNMRSWSDKGHWKAFCFPKDQNRKNDVKEKAKEISNYPGKAWEITYWEDDIQDMSSVLNFWNEIPYSADMISNTGKWSSVEWKSIGVGIQDGYILLWLGKMDDVEAQTVICETGERINNSAVIMATATDASSSTEKYYYIIIGSYNITTDAKSAVTSYKEMGYQNAEVLENGGRLRLSIDRFNSQEDADKALPSYREKFQGAWVFSK